MSDFAPPSGPPPPKVPHGWKAVWNDQYSEWFYVNLRTKKSQWDKPTQPDYGDEEGPPAGPPPTYAPAHSSVPPGDTKGLGSNNPYSAGTAGGHPQYLSEDEALARRLQEEENARLGGRASQEHNRGASNSYYSEGPAQGAYGSGHLTQSQGYGGSSYPPPNQAYGATTPQPQESGKKGGLLSKIIGAGKSAASSRSHQQAYPPQQAGYGYGQPHYGPPGGGYYGQPGYAAAPGRPGGGGMGMMGAGGLGLGAGLLGGALIGGAADAGDGGGDGGGDYGGGDGGGDYGGGDGGGDFGGGDGGGDFGGGGDF